MTMIINVPGCASAGVDWPVLPVVSSDFPLDGLASYLAVQGSPLNGSGRISTMTQWYGADRFVAPANTQAPSKVTVEGVELMRFTRASSERLVSPPAPAGGALIDKTTTGFSVAFPMMLREVTTNLQGICRFFDIGVRLVISGGTLLQVQELGGTITAQTVLWDFTTLAVLGLAYDDVAKNMRIYRNGVQVSSLTAASWTYAPNAVAAIGGFFSGSDFGNVDAGDVARWTRQISAEEMLAASQFLMSRFDIAA